jgi:glutamine synthetase
VSDAPATLRRLLHDAGAGYLHCGGVDHLGTWRGKRVSADAAVDALAGEGVAFSDVFWALTIAEDLVEPPTTHAGYFPVKERGFPDTYLVVEPETFRVLPWLGNEPWCLGSWVSRERQPVALDPRACLRRVIDEAHRRGLRIRAGFEYEFYLLDAPLAVIAAGGFAADLPTPHTRPYTYHGLRVAQDRELIDRFVSELERSGLVVEAANCETGQGQFEINMRHTDAIPAADNAFLMKQAVRTIAAQDGRTATFMAKPRADWAGSSGHIHLSVWSADGETNLFRSGAAGSLSPLAAQVTAGLLATMPAATALCCPRVNSYKRMVPYMWSATTTSWGFDNRSTGLRMIPADEGITRIEHRLAGADTNPYLALAAIIAGILHGVDAKLVPPPAAVGDAYADATLTPLPASLDRACDALAADTVLPAFLGRDLVAHQLVCLRAEAEHHRVAVSEWERRRYLELT